MAATKKREFTPVEHAEIIRMAAENMTTAEIAKALNRHPDSVGNRMRLHGISRSVKRGGSVKKWTTEMDKIVRKYLHLETREKIGKRVGKSKSAVVAYIKRENIIGLSSNVPKPWTPDEDEFLREHVGTMTQTALGKELGRDPSSVSRRLDKLGIRPAVASPVTYLTPKKTKPVEVVPLTARPWLSRGPRECKYLYGERGAYMACCAPTWGQTGMCEDHAALCGGYKKEAA